MPKVSIESLDSRRVDSIVRKHGRVFTVLRQANANDFVGAGFMSGIDEFIGIACECHTPAHFYWVDHNEAKIKSYNEQEQLEF